ncbi:MAG TPA: hypothetical protein VES89_09760 [Candidatus Competibacteraceae bacterium]|nr:hypothetical protein [Candidatus Competibacteraceae bacterium]
MRTLFITLLSTGLLSGCAGLLQDLQDINTSLKIANSDLRTSTPSVHAVTATAEDACNMAAFETGFRQEYTHDWNSAVSDKVFYFRSILVRNPQDAAAQHNYALYRGKRVEGQGLKAPDYGVSSDDPCAKQSYLKGQSAGIKSAGQDLKVLEEQEISM